MSRVTIDGSGVLLVDGSPVFPICVSNPPPVGRQAPSGQDGWQELQAGGVSFVRTGRSDWNAQQLDAQIAAERTLEDAAAQHGLRCWLWLGSLPNLPPAAAGQPPSPNEQLLRKVVAAFEAHPGLGAYKGVDEPLHGGVPAAALVRAYRVLRAIDPAHPVVVVQAPLGTVAELTRYRPAFDITGADIFPVAYPPGRHAGGANRDLSVGPPDSGNFTPLDDVVKLCQWEPESGHKKGAMLYTFSYDIEKRAKGGTGYPDGTFTETIHQNLP